MPQKELASEAVSDFVFFTEMDFFRPRTPLPRDWQYDLPEGKLATPAQSAEYRRRRRRVGLYQGLVLLSLPVFVWFGVTFLRNPVLAFVFFIACPMGLVFLLEWIGKSFCCPVCGLWLDRAIDAGPRKFLRAGGRRRGRERPGARAVGRGLCSTRNPIICAITSRTMMAGLGFSRKRRAGGAQGSPLGQRTRRAECPPYNLDRCGRRWGQRTLQRGFREALVTPHATTGYIYICSWGR